MFVVLYVKEYNHSPNSETKACKYLRSEVEEEHWLAAEMLVGDRVDLSLALEKLP